MGFLPRVKRVHRTLILNPFRPIVAKWFSISANHCQLIEIVRVETDDSNITGVGETMIDYIAVPFRVTQESINRVIGTQVSELMWDDTIGAGLQMALLDATGKSLGIPVYKLFNKRKVRESCPVSWWNMEAPPAILSEEAKLAVKAGYTSHKIKARPWFDIYTQLSSIDAVTPDNYQIDIDWNGQLLDSKRAFPVINKLISNPKIGLFDDPIPRDDIAGQLQLKRICDKPLLTHFFEEWSETQLNQQSVNGYVIDGGVSRVLRIGSEIDRRGMEGFIQLCGTSLTVALSLHLGAVISGAKHPYVSMTTAFKEEILEEPLKVENGSIAIPQSPGLGVEINESQVEALEFHGDYPLKLPRRIYSFSLGDGRVRDYASVEQLWSETSLQGNMPVQPEGATLDFQEDDGSKEFDVYHNQLSNEPKWFK